MMSLDLWEETNIFSLMIEVSSTNAKGKIFRNE